MNNEPKKLDVLFTEGEATQELWELPNNTNTPPYVVVSQVIAQDHGGWETMIFESDPEGNIESFNDLYVHIGEEELSVSVYSYILQEALKNE